MQANQLSSRIWNGISDLVRRSQSPREIYFVEVQKVDPIKKLIFAAEFGSLGIPLVAHTFGFSYFDTVPTTADLESGAVAAKSVKRQDTTGHNTAFQVEIMVPKVGEIAIVLDVFGAKAFPFCIGIVQSKAGAWEEAT
jgi:hypothetical protein